MTEQTDRTGRGQMVRAPANGGAVAKKDSSLAGLLQSMRSEIERAVPRHLTGDRLARVALTALRTTKGLSDCTQASFAGCVMACAALGLECNTPLGQAYLIPRKGECTLVIGYQGMLDLIRRSGLVASIQAFPVFKGDVFEYEQGLNPKLRHIPSQAEDRENKKNLTHAYAIVRLKDKDADPIVCVMSKAQIDARRGRSMAKDSGPWSTDYVAMALKTVVRDAFKWAPRSAEMAQAARVEDVSERHGGAAIINELPEETAKALLGSGIQAPETTEDGEVLDGEFDSSPSNTPPSDTNGDA